MAGNTGRATKNRKERQENLREYLSNQEHVRGVCQIIEKIEKSKNKDEVQILKTAAELKLKLVNKYLPDLKSTELTGEGGGAVDTVRTVKFVKPKPE